MSRTKRAVWALAILGFACGIALIPLLASADFAGDRELWIALDLVIGWGFVGVGAFAWLRRPDNRVGALMIATGFAFYVAVGERTDVPLLFTIGIVGDSLFVATAIHLLLAFPSGRLKNGIDRGVVVFAYAATTVGGFVPALFFDPPTLFECTDCPDNLLLVDANSSFIEGWYDGLSVLGIAVLLATLALLTRRLRTASPPLRRTLMPVSLAGGGLMVVFAALLLAGMFRVSHEAIDVGYYAGLIPFGLVPYVFLGSLARARMLRGGAVGSLVATIGEVPGPGELREAIARALGDPSVDLAYWLPDSERWVTAAGRRIDPPAPSPGRAVYDVVVDGARVGAIVHDELLLEDPDLVEAVGATAVLALQRERLDAELRAKVEELQESRARMIRFGMAERRGLERDLHDGAQQRLVSLALDLRVAREQLRTDPESAERLLEGATDALGQALEELRELARGIHPALLSDRGLDPAVETLARRAPLPVEVEAKLGQRVPEPVELAAYFVVSESLTNVVKYADASRATVRLVREDGRVTVVVADDGVGGADPTRGSGLRGLADRVAALGGRLDVDSSAGEGTSVRARIPCE